MTLRARAVMCIALAISAPVVAERASLEFVDIAVEEPNGTAVTGLTQTNFEIDVAGASRPIESFAAGTERPLSLVLLFDVTASMETKIKRSAILSAVEKGIIPRLRPEDRVQVGSFARAITIGPVIAGPRALQAAVEKALDPEHSDTLGPSPMWDAIDAAVKALASSTGRRAIIVVSDGRATGNREAPEDVGNRAVAAAVAVSVVGEDSEMMIRQDAKTGVRVRPGAGLEWIAATTGGLYLPDRAIALEPTAILERLLAELHNRYTLGFTPPVRDGKVHALNVRVDRPGLTLRARRLFNAPAE